MKKLAARLACRVAGHRPSERMRPGGYDARGKLYPPAMYVVCARCGERETPYWDATEREKKQRWRRDSREE